MNKNCFLINVGEQDSQLVVYFKPNKQLYLSGYIVNHEFVKLHIHMQINPTSYYKFEVVESVGDLTLRVSNLIRETFKKKPYDVIEQMVANGKKVKETIASIIRERVWGSVTYVPKNVQHYGTTSYTTNNTVNDPSTWYVYNGT